MPIRGIQYRIAIETDMKLRFNLEHKSLYISELQTNKFQFISKQNSFQLLIKTYHRPLSYNIHLHNTKHSPAHDDDDYITLHVSPNSTISYDTKLETEPILITAIVM